MIIGSCSGVNHCGNARNCERCARLRQKKIADVAEKLEQQHGQLTLTVLVPEKNTQEEIARLRASFIRRTISTAGIWTIETGCSFAGLHLNILSPRPAKTTWRGAKSYSELVQTTSREAAAYISKRSGMPPVEQFSGRLYGSFGQLFTYLSSEAMPIEVQAAALEVSLSGEQYDMPENKLFSNKQDWTRHDPNKPDFYNPDFPHLCNPPLETLVSTPEQRREIMRKHLPNIMAAMNPATQYKPSKPLK